MPPTGAVGYRNAEAIALTCVVLFCTACGQKEHATAATSSAAVISENKAAALLPFRVGLPPGNPKESRAGDCTLDHIGGVVATEKSDVAAGAPLLADGWVADVARGALPRLAWLVLEGEPGNFHVAAELGRSRFDVAEALGTRALAQSGYRVQASTQGLPAGNYRIMIHSVDSKGLLTCDTHRVAQILPP